MNTFQAASEASRRNFLWGTAAAGTALLGLRSGFAHAQPTPPSPPAPNAARAVGAPAGLQVEKLNDHLTVIMGAGGNIAVHHTDEAVFVVDAGLPDRAQAVVAAVIAAAGPRLENRQRVLFNTHYHFDHIGANEAMAALGFAIVASDDCRRRNSQSVLFEDLGRTLEPLPPAARQVLTFGDAGMTLHLPDEVRLIKIPPSHTDGDAVALFTGHDVLHCGDLFFNGSFPVIDRGTGGSLAGMIAATQRLIDLVNPDTRIIPGHGPMATVADLRRTLAMLEDVRDKLAPFTARRATIDEVLAARPLADLDDTWGRGFLRSDIFTRMAYPRP